MKLTRLAALATIALTLLAAPLGATRVSGQTDPGGVRRLAVLHVISAPSKETLAFFDELARKSG